MRTYRLLGVLGRGGFGTVYRAALSAPGGFTQHVALKVLARTVASSSEMTQRLRDEARLLGLLRHRAIVQVHGLVQLEGRWVIVMELVDGPDLGRLLDAKLQVPPGPALEIVAEAAGALAVAHAAVGPDRQPLNMMHRDLKPTNLLLTPHGELKIVDFGVAKGTYEGRESRTRDVTFGSPGYVAPERYDLIETAAGDVYAVGAVLYELVMGRPLGRADLRPERHAEMVDEALRAATEAGVPAAVIGLVSDLVQHTATARPTAREVERRARDLRAGFGGPWLRDWAESAIPKLPAAQIEDPKEFDADVLTEQVAGDDPLATLDPDRLAAGAAQVDPTAATLIVRDDDDPLPARTPRPARALPPPDPIPKGSRAGRWLLALVLAGGGAVAGTLGVALIGVLLVLLWSRW